MSKDCKEYEIEIAAAGASDLPVHVAHHADGCSRCALLREEALAMAGTAAPGDARAAKAIARRAIDQAQRRHPLVWAVPLLSASASAAALILYFGIFHAPASSAGDARGGLTAEATPRYKGTVPEAGELELPDSLRAVSDLLLDETSKENDQ